MLRFKIILTRVVIPCSPPHAMGIKGEMALGNSTYLTKSAPPLATKSCHISPSSLTSPIYL
jgi:hypothetical protein